MRIVALDHVQLAMPAGGKGAARHFYGGVLGEGLTALIVPCVDAGYPVERDVPLPGLERVHVADPFGNRVEFVEVRDEGLARGAGRQGVG